MTKFDKSKVVLRRFEARLHYHAAYQFWNLKGVLAERWAHGPHLAAYSDSPNELRLVVRAGDPSDLIAVAGIKTSALVAERNDPDFAVARAREWLADCHKVLEPQVVTEVSLLVFHSYPAGDQVGTSGALVRECQSLAGFLPTGYEETHAGIQFQAIKRDREAATETTASGIFGVYGPHQSKEWFVMPDPQPGLWHLGYRYLLQLRSPDVGLAAPLDCLESTIEEGMREAKALTQSAFARVIPHA